jgi:hypothetical protein
MDIFLATIEQMAESRCMQKPTLPQSTLSSKSPLQAMKDWQKLKSQLFRKQPYYLPGYDIDTNSRIIVQSGLPWLLAKKSRKARGDSSKTSGAEALPCNLIF